MAYRGMPNCSTGYSPYYLLHGLEMKMPTEDDLMAKLSPEAQKADFAHRLEDLKSDLRKAFEIVRQNNRKSHLTNKSRYDKRAKERTFEMVDIVYLFSPAKKKGQCQKFPKFWAGPYKITGRLSELNYKIVDMKGKELVVHLIGSKRRTIRTYGDQKQALIRIGECEPGLKKKMMKKSFNPVPWSTMRTPNHRLPTTWSKPRYQSHRLAMRG
jgi:hypothetical protein